jgi:hypothetical protein
MGAIVCALAALLLASLGRSAEEAVSVAKPRTAFGVGGFSSTDTEYAFSRDGKLLAVGGPGPWARVVHYQDRGHDSAPFRPRSRPGPPEAGRPAFGGFHSLGR